MYTKRYMPLMLLALLVAVFTFTVVEQATPVSSHADSPLTPIVTTNPVTAEDCCTQFPDGTQWSA